MVRIKGEHPDDAVAVVNDRVKGSLKVTRAFGAGFLKQVLSSVSSPLRSCLFHMGIMNCRKPMCDICSQ